MTPTSLILKELRQRPTSMATCLIAITLGVTALVAIRSITVFSKEAVERQMSELGANMLLLPKSASLKNYYAADSNGATLPEELATRLLLADLTGVEHIIPKLSVPCDVQGKSVTLTGILPQSEFDAQASWNGVQAFKKKCGSDCKRRAALDDVSGSAAENLAKNRYVTDISKDELILGAEAAKELSLTTGQKVAILGDTFHVAGVMPVTGTVDDSHIFAHLHTVQRLSKSGETINVIELMACCEDAAGNLVKQMQSMFPEAKVLTINQVVDTQMSVNKLMERISYAFFAILLVVGIASIAGTMFANVTERRKEIGTLMALGATPSLISRLVLGKALIIGLAGGLAGYVLGTTSAVVLGPTLAGVTVTPLLSLGGISFVLAAVVSLVSSYWPARRAALIDPCLCFREV